MGIQHEPAERTSGVGLLLSGGLDSAILLGCLVEQGHEVQPFYVRCGLIWEEAEQAAVGRFLDAVASGFSGPSSLSRPRSVDAVAPSVVGSLRPLVTLDLPMADVYEKHWSTGGAGVPSAESPDEAVYLLGRNALLTIKPLLWCRRHGIDRLALAVLEANPFTDATPEFFDRFSGAMALAGVGDVTIERPFAGLDKRAVMERGRRLPLELTFSCIAPVAQRHCGRCNKCTERNAAFRLAGLPDPTDYADPTAQRVNDRRLRSRRRRDASEQVLERHASAPASVPRLAPLASRH